MRPRRDLPVTCPRSTILTVSILQQRCQEGGCGLPREPAPDSPSGIPGGLERPSLPQPAGASDRAGGPPGTCRAPGQRRYLLRANMKLASGFAVIALLAAACGSSSSSSSTTPAAASPSSSSGAAAAGGKFLACMVTDTGGINDKSFNQSSYAGVTAAPQAHSTNPPKDPEAQPPSHNTHNNTALLS